MSPHEWARPPDVVAPAYLRWSLTRGVLTDGSVRWILCERRQDGADRANVLEVAARPSYDGLMSCIVPFAGVPISEALVGEALRQLPGTIADTRR